MDKKIEENEVKNNEKMKNEIKKNLDILEKELKVAFESKNKVWVKGFISGYGSAVTGLIFGTLVSYIIKKSNK